jgi:hypothetical protein
MDTATRRGFLSKVALTAAGATIAPTLAPESSPARRSSPGLAQAGAKAAVESESTDFDPNFMAGEVVATDPAGVLARDIDGIVHEVLIGPDSMSWKNVRWNLDPLSIGDCLFVRGERHTDGVLAVDRLWANISSTPATVLKATATEIQVELPSGAKESSRVIDRTRIRIDDTIITGSASILRTGSHIHLIESYDPDAQRFTASTVDQFSTCSQPRYGS